MSPFTEQPARNSQRSSAVILPFTFPSTMTERVLMSPLILACLPTVRRPCESILPSTSQSISSSFWNFTVPLIETPLDNVPPLLMSVAPLGVGFGFAAGCCGGGGVGGMGAAWLCFWMVEIIRIGGSRYWCDGSVYQKCV